MHNTGQLIKQTKIMLGIVGTVPVGKNAAGYHLFFALLYYVNWTELLCPRHQPIWKKQAD